MVTDRMSKKSNLKHTEDQSSYENKSVSDDKSHVKT